MITVWGVRQDDTWETITVEGDFSPNIVYQFTYTIPEKPWWWKYIAWITYFSPWKPWAFNPKWLKEAIVKSISAKSGIPEDEIKVLWFSYDPDTDKFQIQIIWLPAPSEIGAIPAGGPLTLIAIAIIVAAISIPVTFFIIGRTIENLTPDLVEKIKEAFYEITKPIPWIAILAGIVVTGSLVPLFIPKRKKT